MLLPSLDLWSVADEGPDHAATVSSFGGRLLPTGMRRRTRNTCMPWLGQDRVLPTRGNVTAML